MKLLPNHKIAGGGISAAVFTAALVVRLLFCFVAIPVLHLPIGPARTDFYTATDGYLSLAVNLVDHGKFAFAADAPPTTYRAPGYPVAVAALYALSRNAALAVLIVNCLASALTCVLSLLLFCMVMEDGVITLLGTIQSNVSVSRRALLLPSLSLILFPLAIYYCASSLSDVFFTLTFVAWVASCVWLFRRPTIARGLGSGLAFAWSALTKAVVLPLPAVLVVYAWWRCRGVLRPLLLGLLLGGAVIGGWTARNWFVSGEWIPISGGAGFNSLVGNFMVEEWHDSYTGMWHGSREALRRLEVTSDVPVNPAVLKPAGHYDVPRDLDRRCGEAAWAMYCEDPLLLPRKVISNIIRFWYFSSSPVKGIANALVNVPVVVFALVFFVRQIRRVRAEPRNGDAVASFHALTAVLLLLGALVLAYSVVIVSSSRFCLPVMMVLLPFAVAGCRNGTCVPRRRRL